MGKEFKPFQLGRYRCTEKIGSGGMALIYRAELRTVAGFQKTFAIKKIHRHLASDEAFVGMFVREARISAGLDHGNIVRVLELDEEEGQYYMVMEYVDGYDLRAVMDRLDEFGRCLPPSLAVYVSMEVAKALAYAHSKCGRDGHPLGIVHRDLSPSNVILGRSGEVKILDFGIARALLSDEKSRSSTMKGKYAYMSPEQIRSEEIDGRSDIFALGALFFEMLTGHPLFRGQTPLATIRKVEAADLPHEVKLPPELEGVLRQMVTRHPGDRFAHAGEVLVALDGYLTAQRDRVFEADLAQFLSRLYRSGGALRDEERQGDAPSMQELSVEDLLAIGDDTAQVTIPEGRPPEAALSPAEPSVSGVGNRDEVMSPPETEEAPSIVKMASEKGEGKQAKEEKRELRPLPQPKLKPGPKDAGGVPEPLEKGEVVDLGALGVAPGGVEPLEPGQRDSHEPLFTGPRMASAWTLRNRLILVLSLVAITVAGVALYVVFSGDGAPSLEASPSRGTASSRGSEDAPTGAKGAPREGQKGSEEEEKSNKDPGSRVSPPAAQANSGGGAEAQGRGGGEVQEEAFVGGGGRPPGGGQTPGLHQRENQGDPLGKKGIRIVKIKGKRGAGDLDLHTEPRGAAIIVGKRIVGKTPVRFKMRNGQTLEVVLNKEGRRLRNKELKMFGDSGRKLKVFLPNIRKKAKEARKGQTAVSVTCARKDIYRVYINGWDTGHNCPAKLPVDAGKNNVARRLKADGRLDYKDFRVHTGQTFTISWDD